jgi:hypothetical protein
MIERNREVQPDAEVVRLKLQSLSILSGGVFIAAKLGINGTEVREGWNKLRILGQQLLVLLRGGFKLTGLMELDGLPPQLLTRCGEGSKGYKRKQPTTHAQLIVMQQQKRRAVECAEPLLA